MSLDGLPGTTFYPTCDGLASGLVGTLTVRIEDSANNIITADSTASIIESGIGIYTATRTRPSTIGSYLVIWNNGSSEAVEQFQVTATTAGALTYDPTTALGRVRLELGDTDADCPLFADGEITVVLNDRAGDVLLATADLCEILARRFAREYDFETDQQRFQRSQRSKAYKDLAAELRKRAAGGITVLPTTRVDGYSNDVTSEDVSTSAVSSSTGRVRAGYFSPDRPY